MKLSTRARYGLRALLDLAIHQGEGLILLKDIARREEISLPYLEHVIGPLVAAGLVKSTRGARGGVQLLKPPSEIKLSEVIQLLEGSVAPVDCVNDPALCHRSTFCATRDIWSEMKRVVNGVLEATTLQALIERQRKKGQAGAEMYYI